MPTLVYYGSIIGTAFAQMGRAGEALEYCGAALRVSAVFKDMGFPFYAYACKGQAFTALGRLAEARDLLTQTLEKTRQLDTPLEQTQVLIALGKLEVQVGHPRTAAQYFEEASSLSRKDGFIHSIAWSMYEAARVYRDEGRYADAERCESDARKLYDLLLAPIRQIPPTGRLTIVPDGALWRLPTDALRASDGKYVLESHTVSFAPSSTLLYYLRTVRHPVEPQMAFLGVGAVP